MPNYQHLRSHWLRKQVLINIRTINRTCKEKTNTRGSVFQKHLKSSCFWICSGTLDNYSILNIVRRVGRLIHQRHLHSSQKPFNTNNQLAEGRNGLGKQNKISTMMNAFPLTFSMNLLLGKMSHCISHKF